MNAAITAQATTNETTSPTASSAPPIEPKRAARDLYSSSRVAAPSVGSAKRNENSADVEVSRPASCPATIVVIDRDEPGQREKHCPTPIQNARMGVTWSSPLAPSILRAFRMRSTTI